MDPHLFSANAGYNKIFSSFLFCFWSKLFLFDLCRAMKMLVHIINYEMVGFGTAQVFSSIKCAIGLLEPKQHSFNAANINMIKKLEKAATSSLEYLQM
ncbi:MAG: hypothetical protein EA361_01895 [Bacteroidetes bacterium]|nr:MAG: hypothetical protein EA361_01895 [Bacteroidota bacterium]